MVRFPKELKIKWKPYPNRQKASRKENKNESERDNLRTLNKTVESQ